MSIYPRVYECTTCLASYIHVLLSQLWTEFNIICKLHDCFVNCMCMHTHVPCTAVMNAPLMLYVWLFHECPMCGYCMAHLIHVCLFHSAMHACANEVIVEWYRIASYLLQGIQSKCHIVIFTGYFKLCSVLSSIFFCCTTICKYISYV